LSSNAYLRPPWAARVIGGRMARLFRPSVVSMLAVPGRRTGVLRSVPVAVLKHDGDEYLISAFGDTEWSRNLRSSGGGRLARCGDVDQFTAVEVPVERRSALIAAYLNEFGKLPSVARTFRALPDAADHPAFRITSTRGVPRAER
jgi:deazaflavin-dependent oxidoreductase (nitroreductase family)